MTCCHIWPSVRCSNYLLVYTNASSNIQTYDTCIQASPEVDPESSLWWSWVWFPPKSWDFFLSGSIFLPLLNSHKTIAWCIKASAVTLSLHSTDKLTTPVLQLIKVYWMLYSLMVSQSGYSSFCPSLLFHPVLLLLLYTFGYAIFNCF